MDSSNQNRDSTNKRFTCDIFSGIMIIFCGVFLLFVGLGVIPIKLSDVLLPSILLALGVIFVFTAFVRDNWVSLWMSAFFIFPALVVLIVSLSSLTYSNMYPFFIATPAFASLLSIILDKNYRQHLYTAAFFGILSAIFCLQSFGIVSWKIVLPALLLYLGCIMLAASLYIKRNKQPKE